jgi:hypothetical protein
MKIYLYIAALFGNLKDCKMVLDRGDLIDVKNASGKTPLFVASKKGILMWLRIWWGERRI